MSESLSRYDTPCDESSCDHVCDRLCEPIVTRSDEVCEPLNEPECEYETERQVAELLKGWSGRPCARADDHPWALSCAEQVTVPPGTVTRVRVCLPVLSQFEFEEFSERKLLWELCGIGMNEKDGSCVQLVGGIDPLRVGQPAELCQTVLFHNPSEKTITLLWGDAWSCQIG